MWEWAGIPAIPAIPTVNIPRLRIGIDKVPYDDFPAILHKGERVLRAGEAEEYDRKIAQPETAQAAAEGGKTVNVTMYVENFTGTREDADAFSEVLLERLQEELDKKGRPFQ